MAIWTTSSSPQPPKSASSNLWKLERVALHVLGTTEDETVGWHHRRDRHEFEQALGVGDGQGGQACCSPWRRKESDMTEQLNKNNIYWEGNTGPLRVLDFQLVFLTKRLTGGKTNSLCCFCLNTCSTHHARETSGKNNSKWQLRILTYRASSTKNNKFVEKW